jgi:hypothetical protein
MINYRSLQESLNRPYKWRRGLSTAKGWSADFKTKDGSKYAFQAARTKKYWGVTFSLENPPKDKGSMALTGTEGSGSLRVFATIAQIFEVYVNEVKPDKIMFSADKTERDDARATRAKLYARFSKMIARKYGYDLKTKDNTIDMDFVLTKKKKKKSS